MAAGEGSEGGKRGPREDSHIKVTKAHRHQWYVVTRTMGLLMPSPPPPPPHPPPPPAFLPFHNHPMMWVVSREKKPKTLPPSAPLLPSHACQANTVTSTKQPLSRSRCVCLAKAKASNALFGGSKKSKSLAVSFSPFLIFLFSFFSFFILPFTTSLFSTFPFIFVGRFTLWQQRQRQRQNTPHIPLDLPHC